MTQKILNFSLRNPAPLRCMWIETGNPANPLVCKWISGKQANGAQASENLENEARGRKLCA